MPPAGQKNADRAKAHIKWAARYNDKGQTKKAAAHFGRALEYDRRDSNAASAKNSRFGVGGALASANGDPTNFIATIGHPVIAAGAIAAAPYAEQAARKAYDLARKAYTATSGYMKHIPIDGKTDYTEPVKPGAADQTDQGAHGPKGEEYSGKTDHPDPDPDPMTGGPGHVGPMTGGPGHGGQMEAKTGHDGLRGSRQPPVMSAGEGHADDTREYDVKH
jgi:hypothetical protein